MNKAEISFTTRKPEIPKADFAFYIDYKKGVGSPSRVFAATHDFIKACEKLDKELVKSIDSSIETIMVLEDIEVGSIKSWFINLLKATDDQALKDLDWKPAVGKYLVRAKYCIIRWMEKGEKPNNILELGQELKQIASETDVRHLPDYRTPSPESLVVAIRNFQEVKEYFIEGDKAQIITPDGNIEMNLTTRLDLESIEALAIKEIMKFPVAPMILAVKKPDYLGDSKWEFRHGKRNISAKVEDEKWLREFQSRKIDVRPGDSLKCQVEIENLYGHDNELISENFTIKKITEVLVDDYGNQIGLFDNDPKKNAKIRK